MADEYCVLSFSENYFLDSFVLSLICVILLWIILFTVETSLTLGYSNLNSAGLVKALLYFISLSLN